MSTAGPASSFLPADFDPSDFNQIEPLLKALNERSIDSTDELRQWVADLSALMERIDEYGSRRYIDVSCRTEDEAAEKAYLDFVREVEPRLKPWLFELQQKYLASSHLEELTEPGFDVMSREWRADVEIYRDQNVPLETRVTELTNEYGKISGAMTVEFRGETYTLQQLARFLEEPDRLKRQEAWELAAERRLQDREKLDELFDQMLELRGRIAANAGFDDYRQYTWRAKKRFDYEPSDCLRFGESIERVCVPLLKELDERQRDTLGVDSLRPWDGAVDPKGRPPLRPFDSSDIEGFVSGVETVFGRVSPELAKQFRSLAEHGDLDLESRRGKRPGGFQAALEASRRPFIFMNAAGLQRDVDTMLHEGGHAFHYLASRELWNLFTRHAPMEFCEVASMAMELLGCDHYGVFYGSEEDVARAKRQQLEGVIRKLPWIATIDGFQHWIYRNPEHSTKQRTEQWLSLLGRFSSGVKDWSGQEAAQEAMWQRQLHLFHAPFYYIEYGIAQLGALQVWRNYREDPERTLGQVLEAFALGGTRPLPELFETAGIRFDFSEGMLRPLIDAVAEELERLPD
jgi:oligoendopeptidase F